MGFWSEVGKIVGEVWTYYQVSQLYPTLQDALHKYIEAEGYSLIESKPFAAKIEKQGTFGTKTATLTVLDDGSVHIVESGILGDERVFPKRAGAPTPQEFMQMLEEKEARDHAPQALDEGEKEGIVFRTVFLMFGKIAKGDSLVSRDEINAIEAMMTESDFDQDTREIAVEIFNEGKTTKTPFKEIAFKFAQHAEDIEFRRYVLYRLVQIAAADGALHEQEERYLNDAVAAFGLPPEVLIEAREEILPDIQKYYEILGCNPSVADDELTQCYRKLCQQYHPDRISSKDLAPDFLEFAEQRFKEIQNAYEIITEHRK